MSAGFGRPQTWVEAAAHASADREMADAVRFFRGILGEEWQGWRGDYHFARSFHTAMQGGPREWVRLFRLALILERSPGLEVLVKGLGGATWRDHIAAEQALELCGRFRQAGHRVELIQNTHRVSPDTRVWLHDRPVTIELKALHDRDEQAPWTEFEDEVMRGLREQLMQRDAWTSDYFRFRVEFEDPARRHVAAVVDTLLQILDSRDEAWRDLPGGGGRARFAEEPGEQGWTIPVLQQDDLTRVMGNLRSKWIKQLRTVEGPTLLVVLTEQMFPLELEALREQLHDITTGLRGLLPERRMLGGVLFHEEPFLPPHEPVIHSEPDWRFSMGATEGRARAALLMLNPTARAPLVPDEIDRLVGPDMRW